MSPPILILFTGISFLNFHQFAIIYAQLRPAYTSGFPVLAAKIKAGTFREELYYRLGVVTVKLPPLRDRPEDIPHLARFFLERFSRRYGKSLVATPPFYEALLRQTWPGNAWLPWGIEFEIAPAAESRLAGSAGRRTALDLVEKG